MTPAPPDRIDPPLEPPEQRESLTRSEAVEFAGIFESGIDQWRAGRLLPSTKPHGQRRYARSDLEQVLASTERAGRAVRRAAASRR